MAQTGDLLREFVALVRRAPEDSRRDFLALVDEEVHRLRDEADAPPARLRAIADDLRAALPVTAEAPGEAIFFNGLGEFAGCTRDNTVHVDGFLYSADDVDELCDAGEIPRYVCPRCRSTALEKTTFISHSATPLQLEYVFAHALADADTRGKVVVDVGSRLGAVLYGVYHYTAAARIVGIEFNRFFCDLQTRMVAKHGLGDRIVCDDVRNCAELLRAADIVVLNNVFQFFTLTVVQRAIWQAVLAAVRAGTILVTVPSLSELLDDAKATTSLRWEEFTPHADALPARFHDGQDELAVWHFHRVLDP